MQAFSLPRQLKEDLRMRGEVVSARH
jgi:hypothetical protein